MAIDLDQDFDDGAMFGVGDNPAGPLETRLTIRIDCEASDETVEQIVAEVLARDPWYLALRDAQTVAAEVKRIG